MKNLLSKNQYNNFVEATSKLSYKEIKLLKLELPIVLETSLKNYKDGNSVFLCNAAIDSNCNTTGFVISWLRSVFKSNPMIDAKGSVYSSIDIKARVKFVRLTFKYLKELSKNPDAPDR